MSNKLRYIGLMSGTSADGIDLALVEFGDKPELANGANLLASYYQAYDNATQQQIMSLYNTSANEIDRSGSLNIELAQQFSQAIIKFLQQENLSAADVTAIGCHGQTIRHRPVKNQQISTPFTLQIGCLQTLAL
ncbi:MAG: anhydro-N-acetylmuramic acid kinase, partial [Psychroserpens sp.]